MKKRVQRLLVHSKRAAFLVTGALLLASSAAAQIKPGGNNSPVTILQGGFCGNGKLLDLLTNPVILGIMGVLGVISYGFQTSVGKRDATLALQTSAVGIVAVAAAVLVVGFFAKVC